MSLNTELARRLEDYFKSLGIVAYSNCCRWGCTGSYDECTPNFKARDNGGIFYIRLHLDGMNYYPNVKSCYAMYNDYNYIVNNWDCEKQLLEKFCEILGLKSNEYKITMPEKQEY